MDADLLKGQIRLLLQQKAPFPAVGIKDDGLAAAQMMARGDVSLVAPLLEELLEHAKGYFKPLGNLVPAPPLSYALRIRNSMEHLNCCTIIDNEIGRAHV